MTPLSVRRHEGPSGHAADGEPLARRASSLELVKVEAYVPLLLFRAGVHGGRLGAPVKTRIGSTLLTTGYVPHARVSL